MNYIIAIVGASGSGKTTISRAMAQAGIPDIVSYTTRSMRPGETQGIEHFFISHQEAIDIIATKAIAAYTEFGGQMYFTTMDQLSAHPYCSYVIDEPGLQMLQSMLDTDEFEVIPVFVQRNADDIRAQIGADRIARDDNRAWFERNYYDIFVTNDAPDVHHLQEWAYRFALALLAVLPVRGRILRRCELHASDSLISHIINILNNVKSAL